jgi:transposase-like protein
MEGTPRAIYTKELREEAVKLVTEGGLSIPEVGRRLSVSPSTIRYWAKANKDGKLREVGKQQRPLTEVEMKLARVKRELAIVKKKATGVRPQHSTDPLFLSSEREHLGTVLTFYLT